MSASRRAAPPDAEAVARLAKLAREDLLARRGGAALLAEPAYGAACGEGAVSFLAEPTSAVWIGSWAGADVGYAVASSIQAPPEGPLGIQAQPEGPLGIVRCIWVEPEARGLGVGELLMAAAVEWLRRGGVTAIDAPALPGDRSGKRLLEMGGFQARLLVMRSLPGGR